MPDIDAKRRIDTTDLDFQFNELCSSYAQAHLIPANFSQTYDFP